MTRPYQCLSLARSVGRGGENPGNEIVLDVKSGTALIISSDRVLVFNCSLKARYLFCN